MFVLRNVKLRYVLSVTAASLATHSNDRILCRIFIITNKLNYVNKWYNFWPTSRSSRPLLTHIYESDAHSVNSPHSKRVVLSVFSYIRATNNSTKDLLMAAFYIISVVYGRKFISFFCLFVFLTHTVCIIQIQCYHLEINKSIMISYKYLENIFE